MGTQAATDRQQLVTLARTLERLLGRRRRLNKKVSDLDEQIRQTRKFLNDLTLPDAGWPTTAVGGEAGGTAVVGEAHDGDH